MMRVVSSQANRPGNTNISLQMEHIHHIQWEVDGLEPRNV